ncbi:MAG: DUF3313 family protein, partial [Planctomycetes bacterium]|nr:DUF3313 family protein [Planctomycetota bacterium]
IPMPRTLPLLIAATLLTLLGCTMPPRQPAGFLDGYARLAPDPEIDGLLVYQAPGFDPAAWDRFLIDPIVVRFAPDAKGRDLDPAVLDRLTAYFHTALTTRVAQRYRVVTQPGPGVMRVRLAITDVKKTEPALNLHPATKLSGLGLGGASVEGEGIDTQTGRTLFAFRHTRPGNRLEIIEGLEPWGHAKDAMDFWAERLVGRLDAAHGSTRPGR